MPDYQLTIWVPDPREIQFALNQLRKGNIVGSIRSEKIEGIRQYAVFRHNYEPLIVDEET